MGPWQFKSNLELNIALYLLVCIPIAEHHYNTAGTAVVVPVANSAGLVDSMHGVLLSGQECAEFNFY